MSKGTGEYMVMVLMWWSNGEGQDVVDEGTTGYGDCFVGMAQW